MEDWGEWGGGGRTGVEGRSKKCTQREEGERWGVGREREGAG